MPVRKVLLVDDEPANLKILHGMLSEAGYDLSVASSGERALQNVELLRPDLILLDVRMSGVDGFETCRRLKANPATRHIPVMFVTGSIADVSMGFEVGGVDYLIKPVKREELLARVKTHMQISHLLHEVEIKNSHLQQAQELLEERVRERTRELSEVNISLQQEIFTRREAENRLQFLHRHDYLTHLLNRTAFEEELGSLLARLEPEGRQHVLLYIDLDQFKLINDTCGHVAGDRLLCQIAELLRKTLGPEDIVARLGGDDFAIILCGADPATGRETAQRILRNIEDLRFEHDNQSHTIGASIGMVVVNNNASGVASLLSMADTACYAAKEDGRNRVHVYDENLSQMQTRQEEMRITPRLARALQENRFVLYRQQISRINQPEEGQHYEVLIRMLDDDGGMVPPLSFIGAAERFGMMPQIDRWVIERVLRHLADHPDETERTASCSINLSGLTLNYPGFEEYVQGKLREYGVPAHKICFEITETSAVTQLHRALQFITRIRQLGCKFALDDFGRGVSSYYYLKSLPVDFLKIDGAFVRSMEHDPIDLAMVKSINEIGHAMGKLTIAEYVENDQILQQLKALGVDYGQGYGLARPELFVPAH